MCITVLLRKPNRSLIDNFWSITGDSMSTWHFFYKENLISVASLRTKWEQWKVTELTDMWANLKDPELGIKKFGSESITLLRGNRKIALWRNILKGFLVRCN
jgi:hypothetical protein